MVPTQANTNIYIAKILEKTHALWQSYHQITKSKSIKSLL